MTGWHIRIGYISGDSCKYTREQAWEILKEQVARLREQPTTIMAELQRIGPLPLGGRRQMLQELAEAYRAANADQTITIDEERREIMQLASGDRELKEHVRRAFCRLVLAAMHRFGIDINLTVA